MDIMFYFFLFAIMFFGFLLCGYLAFGPHLEDYSSVPAAASTLLRMIIGEIDYHSIREVNPGFAWVVRDAPRLRAAALPPSHAERSRACPRRSSSPPTSPCSSSCW